MLLQSCMDCFFLLLNIKEDILKNVGNQTVDEPIDFHNRKNNTIEVFGPSTVWLQIFFKISSFVFIRRKKLTHFWVNYPFLRAPPNTVSCFLLPRPHGSEYTGPYYEEQRD